MPPSTAAATITRLGGLTNLVFLIERGRERCVLRIPGRGTEEYINRVHEARAAREAARVHVSPEVLHFDAASGVMVTRYVEGSVTMTPQKFRERPGAPGRAGAVLRQLHRSNALLCVPLRAVRDDRRVPQGAGGQGRGAAGGLPRASSPEAGGVRAALGARALPLAACHCDPLCENFLDTGERMWLVDWEYSGMNDPLWDLGDLSVEGRLRCLTGRGDDPRLLRRRA